MVGWAGSFEWLARQLISFVAFLLPVLATFGAVFLGIYLNGVVDRERERELEVFRPLLDETSKVKDASPLRPVGPLIQDGEVHSVLLDIRRMELYSINQGTQEKIISYLKAVEQLSRLDDSTLSACALLHESGYGEYLREQLPDEMLLESDEGIGSENPAPGPHIVAGHRTVISSLNSVLPSSSTRISGDDRRPLLPILVDNAPKLVELDAPLELRAVFKSHTNVDVAYLDERCPNWADALWDALQQPWQSDPIDYEDGIFEDNIIPEDQHQNIVEGEDFQGVLTSTGIAVKLRRVKHQERVINRAEELHGRLVLRLSQPLYHPKRIMLARS